MRRVVAIVLPELFRYALPTAESQHQGVAALYVEGGVDVQGDGLVAAVDAAARARGVRVGMRVSEAMARTAHVIFRSIAPSRIVSALADVADVASGVGSPVEVLFDDTVLVDCTGVAHLFGGEAALVDSLAARLGELMGPLAKNLSIALADGPFHARVVAHTARSYAVSAEAPCCSVVPSGASAEAIANVSLQLLVKLLHQPVVDGPSWASASGLSKDVWPPRERHPLVETMDRLGVRTFGALASSNRAQLLSRIEALTTKHTFADSTKVAENLLRWLDGEDPRPLVPFARALVLSDRALFEDGVESSAQLLFALRALLSRLSARLRGRRQATNRVDLTIHYDKSYVRVREGEGASMDDTLFVELPAALSHTEDLFRAIKAKLEAFELRAPCLAVEVTLSRIASAEGVQLDLSRDARIHPEALPALLSELSAEIGAERVGVLVSVDDHRPEARSRLEWPADGGVLGAGPAGRKPRAPRRKKHVMPLFDASAFGPEEPTRLLSPPVPLHKDVRELVRGSSLRIGQDDYEILSATFERRLDAVAWWTSESPRRDYWRLELVAARAPSGPVRAWAFVDKLTRETFLHGYWE